MPSTSDEAPKSTKWYSIFGIPGHPVFPPLSERTPEYIRRATTKRPRPPKLRPGEQGYDAELLECRRVGALAEGRDVTTDEAARADEAYLEKYGFQPGVSYREVELRGLHTTAALREAASARFRAQMERATASPDVQARVQQLAAGPTSMTTEARLSHVQSATPTASPVVGAAATAAALAKAGADASGLAADGSRVLSPSLVTQRAHFSPLKLYEGDSADLVEDGALDRLLPTLRSVSEARFRGLPMPTPSPLAAVEAFVSGKASLAASAGVVLPTMSTVRADGSLQAYPPWRPNAGDIGMPRPPVLAGAGSSAKPLHGVYDTAVAAMGRIMGRRVPLAERGSRLFGLARDRGADPAFLAHFAVSNTLRGRHAAVALHVWMYCRALQTRSISGGGRVVSAVTDRLATYEEKVMRSVVKGSLRGTPRHCRLAHFLRARLYGLAGQGPDGGAGGRPGPAVRSAGPQHVSRRADRHASHHVSSPPSPAISRPPRPSNTLPHAPTSVLSL